VGSLRHGNWFFDEAVRVGSFTHQAGLDGMYHGGVHTLAPAERPMQLARAAQAPDYRWAVGRERQLTVEDYLARQRVMGLLIIKDGVVQVERYQYGRRAADRFVSMSMAKSITALAVGIALDEGRIKSLDDRAEKYLPSLKGSLYGGTTLRNLLRMASGAAFSERYDGRDDSARYAGAVDREGVEAAARTVTQREAEQGARFNYAGAQTTVLGAVLRAATGESLSGYLTPRLWQAIGARDSALWRTDRTELEVASGNFNATLEDYGRLGVVLANDGARPDLPAARPLVSREFLLDATDWKRVPEAFRPGRATPYFGYGYQFWLYPGERRRFALIGVYGQHIFVDPGLRLVMVQTSADKLASAGKTTLARERDAFWRGLVGHYGDW
jgi:CubicO group peptidase (beta-lactamase class C family)